MINTVTRESAIDSGLSRYFTGVPCKQGHIAERLAKSGACVVCSSEATKAWRNANKDRVKALDDARRKANPSRTSVYKKEWKKRNKEKNAAINAKYYASNLEMISAKAAAKRQRSENKEKARQDTNKWRRDNPGKTSAHVSARRCKRINATPLWADKAAIIDIYKEAIRLGMTVDHIIPLTHPLVCGLHVQSNLRVIDGVENSKKGNKFNPDEFN